MVLDKTLTSNCVKGIKTHKIINNIKIEIKIWNKRTTHGIHVGSLPFEKGFQDHIFFVSCTGNIGMSSKVVTLSSL